MALARALVQEHGRRPTAPPPPPPPPPSPAPPPAPPPAALGRAGRGCRQARQQPATAAATGAPPILAGATWNLAGAHLEARGWEKVWEARIVAQARGWSVTALTEVWPAADQVGVSVHQADDDSWTVVLSPGAAWLLDPTATQQWQEEGAWVRGGRRWVTVQLPSGRFTAAYAPPGHDRAHERRELWAELGEEAADARVEELPWMVAGDFNAQMGSDCRGGAVGPFTLAHTTGAGRQLADWLWDHPGLFWLPSFCLRPRRGTWRSRLGRWFELDGFVGCRRMRAAVGAIRLAQVALPSRRSDHFPVEWAPAQRLTAHTTAPRPRPPRSVDVSLLRGCSPHAVRLRQQVQQLVAARFSQDPAGQVVDGWEEFANGVQQAVREVVGTPLPGLAPWLKGAERAATLQAWARVKGHLRARAAQATLHPLPVGAPRSPADLWRAAQHPRRPLRAAFARLPLPLQVEWEARAAARSAVASAVRRAFGALPEGQQQAAWVRSRRAADRRSASVVRQWEREFWQDVAAQALDTDMARRWRAVRLLRRGGLRRVRTGAPTPTAFAERFQRQVADDSPTDAAVEAVPPLPPAQVAAAAALVLEEIQPGEVAAALRSTKGAAGPDGLAADVVHTLESHCAWFAAAVQRVLERPRAEWHPAWNRGYQVPLWKGKGSQSDPEAYRGLVVFPVVSRAAARVWARRLDCWAEAAGALPDTQWGFRRGRSTSGAHLVLRRLVEEARRGAWAEDDPVVVFLDLRSAYPRVARSLLWRLLRHWGLPPRVLARLRDLHDAPEYVVRSAGVEAPAYVPPRGLREGCPTSPVLFNIYVAAAMQMFAARRRELAWARSLAVGLAWEDGPGAFAWGSLQFADDTTLLGSRAELAPGADHGALAEFGRVVRSWGGEENVGKRVVVSLRDPAAAAGARFLGIHPDPRTDRRQRKARAERTAVAMSRVVGRTRCPPWLRWQLFRTVAEPVLLFGEDTLPQGRGSWAALDAWQQRWARRVCRLRHRDLAATGADQASHSLQLGAAPLSLVAWQRAMHVQLRVASRAVADPERRALEGRGPTPAAPRQGWPVVGAAWRLWRGWLDLPPPADDVAVSLWRKRVGAFVRTSLRGAVQAAARRVEARQAWAAWACLPSVAANALAPRRPAQPPHRWYVNPAGRLVLFPCPRCPIIFGERRARAAHVRLAHSAVEPCPHCGRQCVTRLAAATHAAACGRWRLVAALCAQVASAASSLPVAGAQFAPAGPPLGEPAPTAPAAAPPAVPAPPGPSAAGTDPAPGVGAAPSAPALHPVWGLPWRPDPSAAGPPEWGGGTFPCPCGRAYRWPQGLRRHWSKGCGAAPPGWVVGSRGRRRRSPPAG